MLIFLHNFSFVEYTSARIPHYDLHNFTHFPENIIVNDCRNWEETVNPEYNQSSISVQKETHFPLDLSYPLEYSSGTGKLILSFDLNPLPPNQVE